MCMDIWLPYEKRQIDTPGDLAAYLGSADGIEWFPSRSGVIDMYLREWQLGRNTCLCWIDIPATMEAHGYACEVDEGMFGYNCWKLAETPEQARRVLLREAREDKQ